MPVIAIPIAVLLAESLLLAATATLTVYALYNLAEVIADFVDRELLDEAVRAESGCQDCDCPPCIPPAGTVGFRIDWVPPSAPHHPCTGSHVHFYIHNQNPNNCMCFWKPNKQKKVLCLPSDASPQDFDPSALGRGFHQLFSVH